MKYAQNSFNDLPVEKIRCSSNDLQVQKDIISNRYGRN